MLRDSVVVVRTRPRAIPLWWPWENQLIGFLPGGRGEHVRFAWPCDHGQYYVTMKEARKCIRIIKRASEWPKRTHVGHFLRLRQAGLQNASNSIFKCKQRNLLDNSTHSKEAQSRIRQASTPNANKRSTDSTNKPAGLKHRSRVIVLPIL